MFGLVRGNPGLQEVNNHLRDGQIHSPMGVNGLAIKYRLQFRQTTSAQMTCFLDISEVKQDGNNDINQGENHYKSWKDLLLWGKVFSTL